MNIKILSDSTCDLSPDLLSKYNIDLVPLTVIKNDQEFKDGVDITPADIFEHVANGGSLCTTSANSVGEYQDMYEKYYKDYDGIIVINISSHFSSCFQNASLAAEDYPNVRVIDSKNLSTGQGLVVLKACELAQNGSDLDAIAAELNEFTGKVEASFLLDQLKYMVKGGRCSAVAALGANLLNLKPCIEVKDGKMSVVKKYRGSYSKCLTSYVKDRLVGREDELDHSHLFITKTPIAEDCFTAVMNVVNENNYFNEVHSTDAGCTVSCHCGPGTLGVLFVRK